MRKSSMGSFVLVAAWVAAATAASASERPIAVSPGSAEGALTGEPCPTFSWGLVDDAEDYVLVVYEVGAQSVAPKAALRQTLPGSVTSWTPSLDRCLERGAKYAWSVRARGTEAASEWSEPNLFEVASSATAAERPRLEAASRSEEVEGRAAIVRFAESLTQRQPAASTVTTLLNVGGGIRAQELCDENGLNCQDLSAGGGGGGGGLQGLETIVVTTTPFNLPDASFTGFIVATCTVGKYVLMGTCTDSAGALDEWYSGGSGPISQQFNDAPGTGYTCRSRNGTGGELMNLTVTATAVCASLPLGGD